ncbi:hypothetical protein DBR40_13215 [Pedobacter sp. KBW01]|uniref:hypothetical protein n=1 Tax=Pedobacter sp. KBW01 TaxID=2153364 RepID=UPI000F5B7ECC|nr:hypothetical protein [Pedobacter sp. KBW01]RQO73763.1 hypothetical protein DBR40_13215 [Pedobacter sp. KBW01]
MNDIPVLVPVKGKSVRCPNKNETLLPFTLNYLKREGFENVYVISDSKELLGIAKDYKFNAFFEQWKEGGDELHSSWSLMQDLNYESFVLSSVTHPFKSYRLISQMIGLMELSANVPDFIATSNTFPDRKQYFLEKKQGNEYRFKFNFKNRKGSLSDSPEEMIDGAIYLIKKAFLEKVVKSNDSNLTFWSGNFSCIPNSAPFFDIDTIEDLKRFLSFISQFTAQV